MKQKRHHSILSLKEMLDYIFHREDAGKRHLLERRMQQDPFLEDAMEGLSMLNEKQTEEYIHNINHRISTANASMRNLYIGIAATIALLIIAGVSVIMLDWTKPQQLAVEQIQNTQEESAVEINEPLAQTSEPETGDPVAGIAEPVFPSQEILIQGNTPSSPIIVKNKEEVPSFVEEDYMIDEGVAQIPTDINSIAFTEETSDDEYLREHASRIISGGRVPGESQPTRASTTIAPGKRNISGTITDSGGQPLPGVILNVAGTNRGTVTDLNGQFQLEVSQEENPKIKASLIGMTTVELLASEIDNENIVMSEDLATLDEVVIVGYGSRRSGEISEPSIPDRPAQPFDGFDSFKRYIRSEAILPDTASVSSVVVKVQFEVSRRGRVINARVISTPGAYDQKAIEIITRGPSWMPAFKEGRGVEESVRLEIEFFK